jgi:hypothetical protein
MLPSTIGSKTSVRTTAEEQFARRNFGMLALIVRGTGRLETRERAEPSAMVAFRRFLHLKKRV